VIDGAGSNQNIFLVHTFVSKAEWFLHSRLSFVPQRKIRENTLTLSKNTSANIIFNLSFTSLTAANKII
jgi:hypothetical protein